MSKAKSNGNGPHPKFDFNRVGRKWEKRFAHLNMEFVEISPLIEAKPREGLSREEEFEVRKQLGELAGRMRALDDERDGLICAVLVDVPREWLLPDAPEVIDWSDVESLDWLQSKRYDELLEAIGEARSAKN